MPTSDERQAIRDKHEEIRVAARANYGTLDQRKAALRILQQEKRELIRTYRQEETDMPKGIGYNNDSDKSIEKLGKAQMPEATNAEKAARKKEKSGNKKSTTRKILNFLRQSGPPPATGTGPLGDEVLK